MGLVGLILDLLGEGKTDQNLYNVCCYVMNKTMVTCCSDSKYYDVTMGLDNMQLWRQGIHIKLNGNACRNKNFVYM